MQPLERTRKRTGKTPLHDRLPIHESRISETALVSYRKAAEGLGKSFHSNPNVDPADAQAALVALAKNFGIVT